MQAQLFIGNLSFSTTEESLHDFFQQFGKIAEIKIPIDRATGRKRGFGFVTFEDPESAKEALTMNGQELDGRPLRVNPANKKPAGGAKGGAGARRASSE